jgi:hypothetical protein
MTSIINFYAGPSTGKSTSAAYIYYLLKSEHKNAELVREYVKAWAWDLRPINTYDQLYFLGKQSRYESMLYNKVDYIVTDSPVMLGGFYAKQYCPEAISKGIVAATQAFYNQAEQDGHKHHHIFLNRTKRYNPAGRYQTEEQAKDMDKGIRNYLTGMGIKFVECDTDAEALKSLIANIG